MKKQILSEELDPTALLNKKLADVAKSNLSGDMWFIKAPTWEGCFLADEENDGNFSYWHLYNQDDEHKGTISVENEIITQLPRNLSESKKIKKEILSEQFKRMQKLAGLIIENENFNEDIPDELDNWLEGNTDYLSASSLEDKVKELLNLDSEITSSEIVEKDKGGEEYGENWNKKLITIKYNGKDLVKVWVSNNNGYDFGKNSISFDGIPDDKLVKIPYGGARFYFDRSLLII